MDILFHPCDVAADESREVNLVYDGDVAVPKHHRVLVYDIVALGRGYDDDTLLGAESEVGRADHVADILDE